MTSQTVGVSASYEFLSDPDSWGFLKRGTVNFSYDLLTVDYDEFSDISSGQPLGMEPLYVLEADIIQIFFSIWY